MLGECIPNAHTAHLGWNSPLGRGAVLKSRYQFTLQPFRSEDNMKSSGKLHLCDWETSAEKSVGLWDFAFLGGKAKLTDIKITSSEPDDSEPVWDRRDRRCSHSSMSWDIYAPDLSAWRKSDETSNCTQWAVKAGSSIHVESQFTPQLGSAGAALSLCSFELF